MKFRISSLDDRSEILRIQNEGFPTDQIKNLDHFKNAYFRYYVAQKDCVVGFIGFQVVQFEAEVLYFAITSEFQNQKIGTNLLTYAVDKLKAEGVIKITLEVRESNLQAQKVYHKLGFKQIAIRKNYYGDNNENGLVWVWEGWNEMIILAVESSCDETSVAIIKDGKEVLTNIVLSQIDIHSVFGGVVPEIASRNHIEYMTRVFQEALEEAKITVEDIDLVAVTEGPGLIGSLLVGINAASAFAFAHSIPLIGVNHMMGHIYAAAIEHEIKFPAVVLLISGGHTELVYARDHLDFEIIGQTYDDAVGEAYDKVARTLGLSYPGGPILDKLAAEGSDVYNLPRPVLNQNNLDFSFSGLKSAVINLVHNAKQRGETLNVNDVAASFQTSVLDVLIEKTNQAIKKYPAKQLIIGGGVSANKGLRKRIYNEVKGVEILIPAMKYCTDNAAMIGVAAYYKFNKEGALPNYLLGGYST